MRRIILIIFILTFVFTKTNAQFIGGMGGVSGGSAPTQTSQVNDSISAADSFSFKKYFSALGHKGEDTLKITHMFAGSLILPGTAQIYNKDYWKLPVIYAGIGGMAYGAFHYNSRFQVTQNPDFERSRNIFIAGAALMYWTSIMDGVLSYKSVVKPLPARSAIFSALLPGLGQAHNGDWWKVPIFYAGLTTTAYLWHYNGTQYERYKMLYRLSDIGEYTGPHTPANLKQMRDSFRRFRDYSIIATVLIYVLQIVDADVFATMSDFDVSDDLSLKLEPVIIQPITPTNNYNYTSTVNNSIGLQLNFKF